MKTISAIVLLLLHFSSTSACYAGDINPCFDLTYNIGKDTTGQQPIFRFFSNLYVETVATNSLAYYTGVDINSNLTFSGTNHLDTLNLLVDNIVSTTTYGNISIENHVILNANITGYSGSGVSIERVKILNNTVNDRELDYVNIEAVKIGGGYVTVPSSGAILSVTGSSGVSIDNIKIHGSDIILANTSTIFSNTEDNIIYKYYGSNTLHLFSDFGYAESPSFAFGNNILTSMSATNRNNLAMGDFSLAGCTTCWNNIGLGFGAGYYGTDLVTGYHNVYIGPYAGGVSGAAYNSVAIGYQAKVQCNDCVQLGERNVSGTANLSFRTQTVISESDIGGGHGLVFSDNSGNYAAKKTYEVVAQGTSITTGVTINDYTGSILTQSTTLAADSSTQFTVTNSYAYTDSAILATLVNYSGSYGTNGFPIIGVEKSATDGQFDIVIMNIHPSNALSGSIKLDFMITGRQNA